MATYDVLVQELSKQIIDAKDLICTQCNTPLLGKNYLLKEHKPYCESCYDQLFSPVCVTCNKPVTEDQYISYKENSYHLDHFKCAKCSSLLQGKKFYLIEGDLHCESCYKIHAVPCYVCQKEIMDFVCSGFSRKWHKSCLKCAICNKLFDRPLLTFNKDMPVHIECYKKKCVPYCMICQKVCDSDYYEVSEGSYLHLECIDKYEKTLKLEEESEGLIEVHEEGLVEKRLSSDEDSDDEKEAHVQEAKKETQDPEAMQRLATLKEEGGDFSAQIVENVPETKIKSQIEEEKKSNRYSSEAFDPTLISKTNQLDVNEEETLFYGPVLEKTTIVFNKFTGEEYDVSKLTKYSYQELLARPLPKDVILSRKEAHLSDQDFFNVFGIEKVDFYKLTKAKQIEQKIKHKLF